MGGRTVPVFTTRRCGPAPRPGRHGNAEPPARTWPWHLRGALSDPETRPGDPSRSGHVTTNLLGRHLQLQKLGLSAQHVPGRVDLHESDPVDFRLEEKFSVSEGGRSGWKPSSPVSPATGCQEPLHGVAFTCHLTGDALRLCQNPLLADGWRALGA